MIDFYSVRFLLLFVLQQRFCLTGQLHFLIETDINGVSLGKVKKFLFSLKKDSLLKCSKIYGHWSVTHKGKRYLLDKLSDRPRFVKRASFNKADPLVNDLLYHDYLVTDVRLVFMRYFGKRLIRWLSLAEIENFKHKPLVGSIRWKRNRHKLKGFFNYPDGILEFESRDGRERSIWIELERSKKKIGRYVKLFEKNINPTFEILEPPLEKRDAHGRRNNGDLIDCDLFFYIVAPFSPSLTPLVKARRKWALDSLRKNKWLKNPLENQRCRGVFHRFFPFVKNWEPIWNYDSDKFFGDDMAYYYSLLPLLPDFEYDDFKSIRFYNWSGVRRPYFESKFYFENPEYRKIVDEFDPVFDFLGVFGKDCQAMDWMDHYVRPCN